MISDSLKEEVYKCIKCGLCMNACPVYKQLYFEAASPRGKVQLIKQVIEGNLEPSDHFLELMFTCLLCENCTVSCPSGLKIDQLMKAMRAELEEKFGLNWQKRMLFQLLRNSRLLSFAMVGARLVDPVMSSNLVKDRKFGTIPYARIPKINRVPLLGQYPEMVSPKGPFWGRVLYFAGCATNYFFENVGSSVISVLSRLGVEVIIPKNQMCCGLPIFLSGARRMAVKNIIHNVEILNRHNVDIIIVDCATCGAALKKEYTNILEEMGVNTDAAKAVAARTQDISQFLARFDLKKLLGPVRGRVTYHDPCHLAKSQTVREEPRNLLKMIPELEFVEMEDADSCCGGGGTFQWEHPEIASTITKKKIHTIFQTGANLVASGCPGCRMQIYGNLQTDRIKVVHPVELVAMAMDR
ncbi:MAG: (Fe-S)-binding protein [Desulfomonilaceae bacterium]